MTAPDRIWVSLLPDSALCTGMAFDAPGPKDGRFKTVEYVRVDIVGRLAAIAREGVDDEAVWQGSNPFLERRDS